MTDRFVCSAASCERDEAVTATASQVKAWLMIEVHGAWGINAVEESALGPHIPAGWRKDLSRRGIRAICIRPAIRVPEPENVRVFFVVAARPGRTDGHIWTRTLPLATVQYVSDELDVYATPWNAPGEGWEQHDDPVVLVCTNGRHDQCCANEGRPVVRQLATTRFAGAVWECSHIGGDRFAANLAIMPDSLYFGRMEPREAETIVADYSDGRINLAHYRGRSTLSYMEQAAEQALREHLGVDAVNEIRIERIVSSNTVVARVGETKVYEIVMRRETLMSVEPLTCRGTPNQRVDRFTATEIRPSGDWGEPAHQRTS